MPRTVDKLEQVRVDKLAKLSALGVDPWGSRTDGIIPIAELRKQVPEKGSDAATFPKVRAAGRLLSIRDKGKVFFLDLQDKTGRIQLFAGRDQVGPDNWQVIQLLDLWDLVAVDGSLGHTRAGEVTIFVDRLYIMTKTIAHPPEKYHGAQDIELRLRRRYIDLVQSPELMSRVHQRSTLIRTIRQYLDQQGFIEVETPTMQAIAGGAAARPFITHHNALDCTFYMRIALELYLKRLLVGGMERVYEIGRVWRNEGIDASHNPEFTMMELYQAYGDYRSMMDLTEGLVVELVRSLGPDMKRPYGDKVIDFSPPWRRATYRELLLEHAGVDMDDATAVMQAAANRGIDVIAKHVDVIVSELFEATVEDHLDGPVFVIDYPSSICPLTKRKADDPRLAERFELFVAGMEIANAYTELNDPLLQEDLFSQQLAGMKPEDSMARMDHDFILALKHGMPPAGGLGIGIDRLVMLLTNCQTIRDVILFPLLRPERSGTDESHANSPS